MDKHDIWGSRSGSKHTQELGKVLGYFFMITYNGEKRMKTVNKALNASNITEWYQKQENQSNKKPQQNEHYKCTPLEEWNEQHIHNWIIDERMDEILIPMSTNIKNGKQLKELNKSKIKLGNWSEEIKRKLIYKYNISHRIKLLDLTTTDKPVVLMDNCVDDFFWIMPPIKSLAKHITDNLGTCLKEAGIEEELDKREGPKTLLEIIGLEWNTKNMTVQP